MCILSHRMKRMRLVTVTISLQGYIVSSLCRPVNGNGADGDGIIL